MSVEALAIVLHHLPLGGTTKLVALGIANHDGDGGAWPSISTLARYANVEPRTVQRAIRDLEAAGYVEVIARGGGTRFTPEWERTNYYRLRIACPPECDRTPQHRSQPVENPVRSASPPDTHVTTPLTATSGAPLTPTSGAPLTPTSPEPSFEPALEPALQPSGAAAPGSPALPAVVLPVQDAFDRWWSLYPRREGKQDARKAYAAALKAKVPEETLLDGARRLAAEGRDPRYIPHPATWIRGRRWEDEPLPPPPPPTDRQAVLLRSEMGRALENDRRREQEPWYDHERG